MYGWIFSRLPGPTWVRVIQCALLIVAIVAVLFLWVFPVIAPYMPFNDQTVGESR